MPVGDDLSRWATLLYQNFPNRPKRMSALDAANAMKAMAEARKIRAEADKTERGRAESAAIGESAARSNLANAKAEHYRSMPTGTPTAGAGATAAARTPVASREIERRYLYNAGGRFGGLLGAEGALPATPANAQGEAAPVAAPTEPMYGDYSPMDYGPAAEGPADMGALPGATIDNAGMGEMDYYGGMGGLNEGFGEQQATGSDQSGAPAMLPNAALPPGTEATNPETSIPLDVYAMGTSYVPKTGPYELEEGEAVIPAHENPANPNNMMSDEAAEAKFSPLLHGAKQIYNALPSAASIGGAIVETPGKIVNMVGNAFANRPSTEEMAANMQGRFARGGMLTDPSQKAPPIVDTKRLAEVAPEALAGTGGPVGDAAYQGLKAVAQGKASGDGNIPMPTLKPFQAPERRGSIPKSPEQEYYAKNPGVEGAWDRMQNKPAVAESLPGTASGADGAPGLGPVLAPAQVGATRMDVGPSSAEQQQAEALYSNIQLRNATQAGVGGGGMMVHGPDGKVLSMAALPTAAEQNISPMESAQREAIRLSEAQAAKGVISPEEHLARLSAIQKMNAPDKMQQAMMLEEGRNRRADRNIEAQNDRLEKMLAAKTVNQQATLGAKEQAAETKRRDKLSDSYNKSYEAIMEIDDPTERGHRMVELNKGFYASLLPPEQRHLAEVPNTFDWFLYDLQTKAFNKKDQAGLEKLKDPAFIENLRKQHKDLIMERSRILQSKGQ